jgi:hypothetical protein
VSDKAVIVGLSILNNAKDHDKFCEKGGSLLDLEMIIRPTTIRLFCKKCEMSWQVKRNTGHTDFTKKHQSDW